MAKATWQGAVLAESSDGKIVEGNYYFPPSSLNRQYFEKASNTSVCPWKGMASYYDVVVGEKRNPGAAWYYPEPKAAAQQIKDHVAFWRGVEVES